MADLLDIILGVDTSQIKTAKQEIQEFGNSFTSATKSAYVFEQAISKAIGQAMKEINFFRDRVKANQDLINSNLGVSNSYKSAQQSASAFGVVLNNLDKVAKATIADFNDRVGITGFFKSAEQSASSFEVVLNNIDRQAKSFTAAFNQKVGITGTRATDSGAGYSALAAQAVKEEAAARELVASATKREADELEYLKTKYNQIYASSQLYERSLVELNQAHMLGVTSTKQHEAALESLNMEYQNFQNGVAQAGNRFAQYAAQTASGMNKFGVLTQQAGYQAGDFIVQVQSGTNAFVAFGQQATQLVGILPMFAAELGISAVALGGITLGLSIAIPLLTAFGAWWMRSGESANKAKEELSDLDTAIKSVDETLKEWVQTKRAAAAGMTIDQMFGGQSLEKAKADLATAQKALDEFTEQSSVSNIGQGDAAAGIALSDWFLGTLKEGDVAAAEKTVTDAAKRVADIQAKLSEEQKASYEEQYASLMQNYAMEKTIVQFGSDSAEVKKLELRQALDDYNRQIDAQVKSNEISAGQGDLLKEINKTGQEAVIAAEEAAKAEVKKAEAIQNAADKATFLKNAFHAMAGEAGAVSTSLKGWAGEILTAVDAMSVFGQYMFKVNNLSGMMGRGLPANGMPANFTQYSPTDYSGRAYGGAFAEGRMEGSSTPPDIKDTTSMGGLGGGGGIDKVQVLLDSLKTQTEVVDAWYEESQKTLQSASDKELEIIGGRHEAELRLETEHQQKMAAIKEAVKQNNLSIVLGSGAQILSALGAHNEKAAKMAKVFGAAQALADTYAGAAAALKLPFPANLAAAASIISAGLGFVSAIKSGGTASASGGGKSVGSVSSSAMGGQTVTPQTVIIQGIKPTDVFTGEQLSTLFDSLYKENRNRGMVFQVAR